MINAQDFQVDNSGFSLNWVGETMTDPSNQQTTKINILVSNVLPVIGYWGNLTQMITDSSMVINDQLIYEYFRSYTSFLSNLYNTVLFCSLSNTQINIDFNKISLQS